MTEQELKVSDNIGYIKDTTNKLKENSRKIIESAVDKEVGNLKSKLNKIPEIYQKMKNNLTVNNNKEIKRMNENIANTGNHTASGYAISKRLNNINEYNNKLSDIDKEKLQAEQDIKNEIAKVKYQGEVDKLKAENDAYEKGLDFYLKEKDRQDDYYISVAKINEEQRVNDGRLQKNSQDIEKSKNDIKLDNKEDLRRDEENQRKNDLHELDMKYLPLKNEADIEKTQYENELILSKIQESLAKTGNKSSGSNVGSNKSSGGSLSSDLMSKMSAKDIAKSIKDQIGSVNYDSYGKETIKFSKSKAFTLLRAWQKKYNLPDYIVNDASIYLGIQDYL